eukprot:1376066-Amorphochlora_amoeboformis.AAC.2
MVTGSRVCEGKGGEVMTKQYHKGRDEINIRRCGHVGPGTPLHAPFRKFEPESKALGIKA